MAEKRSRRRADVYAAKQAKTARKHAAKSFGNGIATFLSVIFLIGFISGGIYLYLRFYTEGTEQIEAQIKHQFSEAADDSYTLIEKRMIAGEVQEAQLLSGQKSKNFATWSEPRFYFVCLGDKTRQNIVFEVPESIFNSTPRQSVFTAEYASRWTMIVDDKPEQKKPNPIIEKLEELTGIKIDVPISTGPIPVGGDGPQ
ncbi:MAG: hypothetical protein AAFX93_09360 [Verrucomicrobiota bacterium]